MPGNEYPRNTQNTITGALYSNTILTRWWSKFRIQANNGNNTIGQWLGHQTCGSH